MQDGRHCLGEVAGLRHSRVMSVSSDGDPEGGQGAGGVAGVAAQGGGEVDRSAATEHADCEVAQACHDLRASPGAQLGCVLGEGHIPHPVQAVLDRPVAADEVGQPGRAGLSVGEAGDRIGDHRPPSPSAKLAGLAGDPDDLGGVREAEPADRDRFEGDPPPPHVLARRPAASQSVRGPPSRPRARIGHNAPR
jgi:hypothetical protein